MGKVLIPSKHFLLGCATGFCCCDGVPPARTVVGRILNKMVVFSHQTTMILGKYQTSIKCKPLWCGVGKEMPPAISVMEI